PATRTSPARAPPRAPAEPPAAPPPGPPPPAAPRPASAPALVADVDVPGLDQLPEHHQGVELRHRGDLDDRLDVVGAVDAGQHEAFLRRQLGRLELLHAGRELRDRVESHAVTLDLLADLPLALGERVLHVAAVRIEAAGGAQVAQGG